MSLDSIGQHLAEIPEAHVPMGKYAISFQEKKGWDCYGVPSKSTKPSSRFAFLNSDDFFARNMSGAVAGRETRNVPEYPIYLGERLPPAQIRGLTFLGERMTDAEFQKYLVLHEIGHAAFNRDMALVLANLVPENEINYLRTMSEVAKRSREEGKIPLSKLYTLACYDSDEKKFLEDLADMYAIYGCSQTQGKEQMWDYYKSLVLRSNSDLESLFTVIEELYRESQKGEY